MKKLTALFLCVVIMFTACAQKFDAEAAYDDAKVLLKEKEYEDALELFLKVIKADSENYKAYVGAADAYLGMKETDEAIDVLEEGYDKTENKKIKEKLDELKEARKKANEPPVTDPPPSNDSDRNSGVITTPGMYEPPVSEAKIPINLYAYTDEVPNIINRYLELHPDVAEKYVLNASIFALVDVGYENALNQALSLAGGGPDIYCAEASYVLKYTQGDASGFAMSYRELGIDVSKVNTANANIAPYAVQMGSRPDGELAALPYQSTGGAMIYRRSIAKDVFGTDDSVAIANEMGPGWDKFMEGAAKLGEKGYAAVSGLNDVWHAVEGGSKTGWLTADGRLNIDVDRERFLDMAKTLKESGYMHDTVDWQDPWFYDMAKSSNVFAFFGPAWLINYSMALNAPDSSGDWAVCTPPEPFMWGGTWLLANKNMNPEVKDVVKDIIEWATLDTSETGLQYMWANGTLFEGSGMFPDKARDYASGHYTKDTVPSLDVMSCSDGAIPYLGGQNMYDVYFFASAYVNADNKTPYDEMISALWRDEVNQYVAGYKSRDDAIADFKQSVYDNLGIE